MAGSVLVDSSFLVALLRQRDSQNAWAADAATRFGPPWHTCEAVLSETVYVLGPEQAKFLLELLTLQALHISFAIANHLERLVALMQKYTDVPMSLADACLVRMTEILPDPVLLTTDGDFRIYRRHGRQVVPCELPG